MTVVWSYPTIVCLVLGAAAVATQRLGRRDLQATLLAWMAVLTAVSILVLASLYSIALLLPEGHHGWCSSWLGHNMRRHIAAGVAGIFLVGLFVARGVHFLTSQFAQRRRIGPCEPIVVIDELRPIALALHGRPGSVVVSTGLLDRLTRQERMAVFAHETAHLELRHHRPRIATAVACRIAPILQPLKWAVEYATERAADEVAARAVGSRKIVANAIVATALGVPTTTDGALGFADAAIARRIRALDEAQTFKRSRFVTSLVTVVSIAVVVVATAVQVHHLAMIIGVLA